MSARDTQMIEWRQFVTGERLLLHDETPRGLVYRRETSDSQAYWIALQFEPMQAETFMTQDEADEWLEQTTTSETA